MVRDDPCPLLRNILWRNFKAGIMLTHLDCTDCCVTIQHLLRVCALVEAYFVALSDLCLSILCRLSSCDDDHRICSIKCSS